MVRVNRNDELNTLSHWQGARCVDCGRTPKETTLNIEGYLHHGCAMRCVDRKSCERIKRRRQR